MGRGLVALVLLGGCSARLGPYASNNEGPDSNPGSDGGSDSNVPPPDGPDPLGAWGTPTPIPGASTTTLNEDDETLSSDATEMIFAIQTGGNKDLYVMKRATRNDAFGAAVALPATINTAGGTEESPRLSIDDLALYFGRDGDIYKSTRSTKTSPWGTPAIVTGSGDTASYEKWLAVCGTNHFMVSRDNGANGQDLFEGTLGSAGTIVPELNSTSNEISTFLSPDCLTVYFASSRSGQTMIYIATRATMASVWSPPTAVGTPFDTGTDNEDAWISTDQRIFVFASERGGATTKDLYISTR